MLLLPASSACDVHVDASARPGGDGSPGAPFATIAAAQLALRAARAAPAAAPHPAAPAPTRVCLASGVYRETLRFTAEDSGGAGASAPVIYEAAPGAANNVSISGALPVAFAPLAPDDPARALLPPGVAASVVVADLFAAGLTPAALAAAAQWLPRGFGAFGGCRASPLELVVGGRVQEVARWPDAGDTSQGTAPGFALTAWHAPSNGLSNGSLWVNASATPWLRYADLSTLQLHGWWHYEWADGILPFGGVLATDGDLVQVALAGMTPDAGTVTGAARYHVANALEALSAPGEYFVNVSGGRLYWLPGSGNTSGDAVVTVNETLITFDHTSDVWLSSITIEAARGHGIQLLSARGIVLHNVTVRNIGQDAVNAYLTNDTLVAGSRLLDAGCAGARFSGGGDRLALQPSGNTVVDSEIARFDRLVFTYNPAVDLDTGAVAAHNDLHDSPHFCVSLDGNDVAVLGNLIHGCSAATYDSAAIYFYPMDWSKRNVTIRWNFFFLNAQGATTCNAETSCNRDAIYPDNGSAAPVVEMNVVYHPRGEDLTCEHCTSLDHVVSYGYFMDGTRESSVRNNLWVLDGANFSFNGAAGLTWDSAQQGNGSVYLAELRAVAWNDTASLFARRYPALSQLRGAWPPGGAEACAQDVECGPSPALNAFSANVIVNATALFTPPPPPFNEMPFFNFSGNFETDGDPGFVAGSGAAARAALNFQLRDDSPVYSAGIGFQRIPTECFGPGLRCPGEPDWGAAQRALLAARTRL
jgi:hypothetical protein